MLMKLDHPTLMSARLCCTPAAPTHLLRWPVVRNGNELPSVRRTEVHAPRPSEERGVPLAHQPHSGRVDDRGHLLDVVN